MAKGNFLHAKVLESEKQVWMEVAKSEARSLSSWVRYHLNKAARNAIITQRRREKQLSDGGS